MLFLALRWAARILDALGDFMGCPFRLLVVAQVMADIIDFIVLLVLSKK